MRRQAVSAALGVATLALPATDAVAAIAKSGGASVAPKKTVVTKSIQPSGQAVRTVSFGALPQGTYRVTVEGDGVSPVHDVFLVM